MEGHLQTSMEVWVDNTNITDGTNVMWHRGVLLNPSISTANLKKNMLLQDISITTIQYFPQKDLNLPSRCADKKPLLTSPMMKRKLQFMAPNNTSYTRCSCHSGPANPVQIVSTPSAPSNGMAGNAPHKSGRCRY